MSLVSFCYRLVCLGQLLLKYSCHLFSKPKGLPHLGLILIALKHDDVRNHNKPGARCIAGDLRGPAVEADGKQAVRNALAVVY